MPNKNAKFCGYKKESNRLYSCYCSRPVALFQQMMPRQFTKRQVVKRLRFSVKPQILVGKAPFFTCWGRSHTVGFSMEKHNPSLCNPLKNTCLRMPG